MNSNLPPGSTNDPNAPWNDTSDFCRVCDSKHLQEIAEQESEATGKSYEDCLAEIISTTPICKHCFFEELADDTD